MMAVLTIVRRAERHVDSMGFREVPLRRVRLRFGSGPEFTVKPNV